MHLRHALRHLTAWIACFAILLAALAPSVSHALAATKGSSNLWMEICTTSAKPTGKGSTTPSPATHFEHCPFCMHHADTSGPPPSATFAIPVVRNVPHFPALFYQSPRPLFLWTAAQSRAPPTAT